MRTTRANDGHDQRADHAAEHRAFAAREASAADDHGCDHVEFKPDRDRGIADCEARKLEETCQARGRAGKGIDEHLEGFHANTAQPRRVLIRANGDDVFAHTGIGQESAGDQGEDDEQPYPGREQPPCAGGQCREQVDEIGEGGVNFLFASEALGNAAHDQERAQGDDKRHDAKPGDDRAIDKPAQRAGENADERRAHGRRARLQSCGYGDSGKRDDRPHGQVDATGDDDQRHAQRSRAHNRGLTRDSLEGAPAAKTGRADQDEQAIDRD